MIGAFGCGRGRQHGGGHRAAANHR